MPLAATARGSLGEHLLADAGLAEDQHADVADRDAIDEREQRLASARSRRAWARPRRRAAPWSGAPRPRCRATTRHARPREHRGRDRDPGSAARPARPTAPTIAGEPSMTSTSHSLGAYVPITSMSRTAADSAFAASRLAARTRSRPNVPPATGRPRAFLGEPELEVAVAPQRSRRGDDVRGAGSRSRPHRS